MATNEKPIRHPHSSDPALAVAPENVSMSLASSAHDRAREEREWTIERIESVIGSVA